MNIQICNFYKRCHVGCHTNWDQDLRLILYPRPHFLFVKYWKKADLILLNFQDHKDHRVHYFHDLGQSHLYCIKEISWITAGYLQ